MIIIYQVSREKDELSHQDMISLNELLVNQLGFRKREDSRTIDGTIVIKDYVSPDLSEEKDDLDGSPLQGVRILQKIEHRARNFENTEFFVIGEDRRVNDITARLRDFYRERGYERKSR